MIEHLLTPCTLGNLSLKNRVIYSAMTFKLSDHKGHLTQPEIDSMLYRAKQDYGPAMIIFPGMNDRLEDGRVTAVNINSDDAMFSLKNQVKSFKKYNVKVAAELGVLGFCNDGVSYGASSMQYPFAFKEMTQRDIERFLEKQLHMACRAKNAGFDAIILQTIVNKKILGNFISPYTNHRTDAYGGGTEQRAKILVELLTLIREHIGESYPIILDLKMDELIGEKGLQLDEALRIAEMVAPYVTAIRPCIGSEGAVDSSYAPYFTAHDAALPYVAALVKHLPEMPVIASCKLGDPDLADAAVAKYGATCIELGRPLFADPQWITKAAEGKKEDILQCIGCLNCYTEGSRKEIYPVQRACTVNPCNLREETFYNLRSADEPKKILVVGGGLAGMEAAATLAKRGHDVCVCERTNVLGGQFLVAASEEEKADYRTLVPYKKKVLEESGAKIRMQTLVDKAYLEQYQPDIVVLATGAQPNSLSAENLTTMQVVQGNDVLQDKVQTGKNVVVIGGRFIGLSVALKLAKEGKHVTIVDMATIANGANPRLINYYNRELVRRGAAFYPNCPVVGIEEDGAEILHLNFPVKIPADTAVQAIGTHPVRDLVAVLEDAHIPYVCIGDCKRIGDALYAVRDGAEVGRML